MIFFHPRTHLVNVPTLASQNYDSFSSCTCDDLDSFENNGLILQSPSFWLYLFFFFWSLCDSGQFSLSVMSVSLWPQGIQHARLAVHHQILGLAQTHVHWVSDAIQPPTLLLFDSFIFDFWETWGKLSLLCNVKGIYYQYEFYIPGFCGSVVKNPPCNAGDMVQFLFGELKSHLSVTT